MKVVRYGESQTDTYKGQSVRGILIQMYAVASAVNTELVNTDFQFRNTSVSLSYYKGGSSKPITILSTTMDVIMKIANYDHAPIKAAWAINVGNPTSYTPPNPYLLYDGTLQTSGVGTKDIRLIGGKLIFPCDICLEGDDKLDLTVNFAPGTIVATGQASGSDSYIQFSQVVGKGCGHGLPKYDVLAIQQNQANVNVPIGNGVEKVYFINTDRNDSTIANSVIQNMSTQSKGKSETLQYNEVLGHRSNQSSFFWADYHYGDYCLFEHRSHKAQSALASTDLHGASNVNINLNLNVANVTASNNYVVSVSIQQTVEDLQNYIASRQMRTADTHRIAGTISDKQHADIQMSHRPFKRK